MDNTRPNPVGVSERIPALTWLQGVHTNASFEDFYRCFGIDINTSQKLSRLDGHDYKIHRTPFQNREILETVCPKKLLGFEDIGIRDDAGAYLRSESCDLLAVGSPISCAFSRAIFGYQAYPEGTEEHDLYGYLREQKNAYPGLLKWGVDKADIDFLGETPFQAEFKRGNDVAKRHSKGKNWHLKVKPEYLLIEKPFCRDDDVLLIPEVDPVRQDRFLTDYLVVVSMPNFFRQQGRLFILAGTHRPGTAAVAIFFREFEKRYEPLLEEQRKRLLGTGRLADQITEEIVFRIAKGDVNGGNSVLDSVDLVYYSALRV
jgi:hypothetical protein